MSPGAFVEAVIEGQGAAIEPDVRCSLHIVVAAEDIGAVAKPTDIAGDEQGDAARPDVCRPDGMLRLAHAPNQRRRLVLRELLRDPLELLAGNPAHPFDLFGRPFRHFPPDLVDAIDALADELLVLPAIVEDVPQHSPKYRDVRAGADADVIRRVRGGARHPRI